MRKHWRDNPGVRSKHYGSKKGYRPPTPEHPRGNTWRAMSRPVRSLPGWQKRQVALANRRESYGPKTVPGFTK
jgi:hypothetical protein